MTPPVLLDPLYGTRELPGAVWDAALTTEVQRLREVRMCNINSLTLLGAASVNRFEHSIGTALLAQESVNANQADFDPRESELLVLAGLLHDVGTAGFGHSVEYVLKSEGFAHEDLLSISLPAHEAGFAYQSLDFEPLYFGQRRSLLNVLGRSDLEAVASMVRGDGRLGPLINGRMDLDNVDNVYRLAYHMGLAREVKPALTIARSLWPTDDGIVLRADAIEAVVDWYETRRKLYHHLLLNIEDFSAKCMLEVALRRERQVGAQEFVWNDVDFATMTALHSVPGETSSIAARLMVGDLFGCIGIYQVPLTSSQALIGAEGSMEEHLQSELVRRTSHTSLQISVHIIWDVQKTEREIQVKLDNGSLKTIGRDVSRVLIGVFARNRSLNHLTLSRSPSAAGVMADVTLRALQAALGEGVALAPQEQRVESHVD